MGQESMLEDGREKRPSHGVLPVTVRPAQHLLTWDGLVKDQLRLFNLFTLWNWK
jgi:hypothetical protein